VTLCAVGEIAFLLGISEVSASHAPSNVGQLGTVRGGIRIALYCIITGRHHNLHFAASFVLAFEPGTMRTLILGMGRQRLGERQSIPSYHRLTI